MSSKAIGEDRARKIKRRSRFGCRNCKLRRIKCDEGKPQCRQCTSFGVICNKVLGVPDLQPVGKDSGKPVHTRSEPEPRAPPTNAIWTSDGSTLYHLDTKCQRLISGYLGGNAMAPTDAKTRQVNNKLLALSFTHPHLMHAYLAVAFAYDRHVNCLPSTPRTLEECYHWSRGTSLFNDLLREPIATTQRDSVWGCAAALTMMSFASPDASVPEDSWPLKCSTESADLPWLPMSRGKLSLWSIVDPTRPDSLFHPLTPIFAEMESPLPIVGIDGIPPALAQVCGLHELSTADGNVYLRPAHAVSQIMHLPRERVTIGRVEVFVRSIDARFQLLLLGRDPIALLLLYIWYLKAGQKNWWIRLRTRVECPAIRLYLQRYHADNVLIQAILLGSLLPDSI